MAQSSLITTTGYRARQWNLLKQLIAAFDTSSGHSHDGTDSRLITASTSLDSAYDYTGSGAGRTITVDSGAVALTNNAANNNGVLAITKSPVGAQSGVAVLITVGAQSTGAAFQIANSGSGNDVTGAAWSVTVAGVATFDSLGSVGVIKFAADTLGTGSPMIGSDNTGDLTANAVTGKQVHLAVNDVDIVNVSATGLAVAVGGITAATSIASTTSMTCGNVFTVTLGGAAITGDSTITGALHVTGALTVDGSQTFTVQVTMSAGLDMNGTEIVLDVDGDTSITADTGNQIDFKLNGTDYVSITTTKFDINALELVLDADGDTSITADTGNQIDFKIANADDFQMTANTFTVLSGSNLAIATGGTLTATGIITVVNDTLFGIGTGNLARFSWDTTDANANELLLQLPAGGGGTNVPAFLIGVLVESVDFALYNASVDPVVGIFATGAVTTAASIEFRKSRGTNALPTAITTGDDSGNIKSFVAVAAGEWVQNASIEFDSTGTIATTRGPGIIKLRTATDAAPSVLTTALTIDAAQLVTAAAGITVTTGAVTISSGNLVMTSGDITFAAAASDIIMKAATAAALEISDGTTKFYAIDTRVTTVGVISHTLNTSAYTLASAANATATTLSVAAHTLNYTGGTQVTTQVDTVVIGARSIAGDGAITVDEANSLLLVAPTEGANVTLTAASALRIINAGGTPVSQYGIYIEDLTVGATNDVGIYIAGADTAAIYIAADPLRLADNVTLGLGTGTGMGAPDATITYNGTNVVVNPKVIGTGVVAFGSGEAGTTAGSGSTLRAIDVATGGAGNVAGADLTIMGGLGTGTGTRGLLIFRTPIVAAAGDNAQTLATLMTMGEAYAKLQAGGVFQSDGAAEICISVDDAAVVVGSEGSMVIPYRTSTAASFDDTAGGNVNGAIGIQYDSDTGPTSTIEVRSNGAWVSVAVSGTEIQGYTSGGGTKHNEWWHANQIVDAGHVDETICLVCGERMVVGELVAMYANYERTDSAGYRNLHAIYGHQHIERDEYIKQLEARIAVLEKV